MLFPVGLACWHYDDVNYKNREALRSNVVNVITVQACGSQACTVIVLMIE